MHDAYISADVHRIILNASCMTISGGRTEQLDIIACFLSRHWLYEWFSQFRSMSRRLDSVRHIQIERVTDGQTDRKTDRRNYCSWTRKSRADGRKNCAIVNYKKMCTSKSNYFTPNELGSSSAVISATWRAILFARLARRKYMYRL